MFQKAINQSTLFPVKTEKFLEVVERAGFRAVELRVPKVVEFFQKGRLKSLRDSLNDFEIEVISLNSLENFNLCSDDEFREILKKAELLSNISETINCDMIVAFPTPYQKGYREKVLEQTASRLKQLSTLADNYNTEIALEFSGFSNYSVNKASQAWKVVNDVDEENLSLVVDVFHFYLSGESLEALNDIPIEKIFLHMSDVPKKPKERLRDKDRIFPGDGIISFKDFLNYFKRNKFDGYVSIELFNENYWKEDPFSVAEKSMKSLRILK